MVARMWESVIQHADYLRQVQVDLISVKVGIERRAVGVVHADCALALHMQGAMSTLAPAWIMLAYPHMHWSACHARPLNTLHNYRRGVHQQLHGGACEAHLLYLEHTGAVGHHARLVQRRLPVGQHQVAVAQVAVNGLALARLGGSCACARQQLLCNRIPLLLAHQKAHHRQQHLRLEQVQ
jgi:hypothetical protein